MAYLLFRNHCSQDGHDLVRVLTWPSSFAASVTFETIIYAHHVNLCRRRLWFWG